METDMFETALTIFRRQGGVLRTSEAIRQGIHRAPSMPCATRARFNHSVADFTAWLICHHFPILTW